MLFGEGMEDALPPFQGLEDALLPFPSTAQAPPTNMVDHTEASKGSGRSYVNVVVVDQEENRTYFKMSTTAPMDKLMGGYWKKHNKRDGTVEFLYEGKRLTHRRKTTTPSQLGMKDGDKISALEHGLGGSTVENGGSCSA